MAQEEKKSNMKTNKKNYSQNKKNNSVNDKKKSSYKNKNIGFVKDDKLKPIRPTLREKKRFIKVKIKSKKKFNFKEISEGLNKEIIYFVGAIDFGKGGIWILKDKFDEDAQTLIIKVGTKQKDKVIGALALIKNVEKVSVKISVLNVSGNLKHVS